MVEPKTVIPLKYFVIEGDGKADSLPDLLLNNHYGVAFCQHNQNHYYYGIFHISTVSEKKLMPILIADFSFIQNRIALRRNGNGKEIRVNFDEFKEILLNNNRRIELNF